MRILQLFADKPVSRLAIMGCFAVLMVLPWLHLLPADSALHLSAYWVTLIGKIMCLAMVALALDLVWGYAGILSLGHGHCCSHDAHLAMFCHSIRADACLPWLALFDAQAVWSRTGRRA